MNILFLIGFLYTYYDFVKTEQTSNNFNLVS